MSDFQLDQLKNGAPVKFEKNGKSICVVRVDNEVFAIDDTCSHSDASLSEGEVTDFKIELGKRSRYLQILHCKHIQ